jgi:hypothetical protein
MQLASSLLHPPEAAGADITYGLDREFIPRPIIEFR